MYPAITKYFFLSMMVLFSLNASSSSDLSKKELSWIAANRVVTYDFNESWPLDFKKGGEHIGLSREYLTLIENTTGLQFRLAGENEKPALITNFLPELMPATERYQWRYSQRWLTVNALIITSREEHHIRTLEHLSGKRVAVRAGGWHERWLMDHHPEILQMPQSDVRGMLDAVLRGEVQAAISADVLVRPILYRNYSHHLAIAGMLPEMVSGVHMGVSKELPELQSILNKALSALPVSQSDSMFNRWLGDLKLGYPSRDVIMSIYSIEITLFVLLLFTLFAALYHALLLKRRAVRNEARKTQFLAMMSHEIRTPMNALLAALELLRFPASEAGRRDYITLAHRSSRDLLRLLDNILEHSRLSQKQVRLDRNCFSLGDLISSLSETHQPAAQKKGLFLHTLVHPALQAQWVVADEGRLRQVISNLLSNAIKFTDKGSVELILTPVQGMDWIRFRVEDTGIGIPPAAGRCLFEAWTQAGNVSVSRHGGSGLGLYICRELVRLAGGTLTFKSRPGQGSIFTLEMPVTFCEKPTINPPVAAPLPRFTAESCVLVVEDHPGCQKMLAAQLSVLGCESELASDGASALRKLEEEHYYTAVLMDCNLPDMDGYEVAKRIHSFEYLQGRELTPIVAISAISSTEHHQRCMENGMSAVLSKPITIDKLGQILSRWCSEDMSSVCTNRPSDFTEYREEKDVEKWLHEDIHQFCAAAQARDLRSMKYYLHRLKGAAMMYSFSTLAQVTEEIEETLSRENFCSAPDYETAVNGFRNQLFSAVHL